MNKIFKNPETTFWLFTILVAMSFILPNALSRGMFVDGEMYANISRNLSENHGTFWAPFNTEIVNPKFFDHPPLVFGIESIFFKLFGDGYLIEKLYSVLTGLITAFFIVKIWKLTSDGTKQNWLPVLLWIITPLVYWAYVNNLLEDTMGVFCIGSCVLLFYAWKHKTNRFFLYCLSGLMVCAGILCKGPFALFPLAVPGFYWLITRRIRFTDAFISSLLLVIVPFIVLLVLYQWSAARTNLLNYVNIQLFPSIKGERDFNSVRDKLYLIKELGNQFIPIITVISSVLIFGFVLRKKESFKADIRLTIFFLTIGIAASFPVMISAKQMIHYVLCSLPFYAMSAASFIIPYVSRWNKKINTESKFYKFIQVLILTCIAGVFLFSLSRINTNGRDIEILDDLKVLGSRLPDGESIATCTPTLYNFQLAEYLYRFHHISLVPAKDTSANFMLMSKNCRNEVPPNFVLIPAKTNYYFLYQKKQK